MYAVLQSKAWNDAGLFVDACAETEGNKAIASYIGTPFVARDLLKIVDALGEDRLLRFWGRSYSTILGQTFAAMFPDRVGRILLDSTLRLDDYYSGQWQTANRDTEYSMLHFFQECVNAGPEICPMANFTGARTTAQSLLQELADVFQELLDNPIIMPPSYVNAATPWWQPGNTLYQELKYMIFTFVYYPSSFPILTYYIDLAFKRDWQTVLNPPAPAPPSNSTAAPEIPWHLGINAFHGIACADAAFRAKKPEDMYSLVRSQGASSSWADVFAPQTWPCAQWRFKAAEHFEGPFLGINTSYPILVANSPFDPITPLSGAWEASANLLGSRLLVHKGHGVSA
jgi:pimeloyl-ACP methyl ester carboxylesterase